MELTNILKTINEQYEVEINIELGQLVLYNLVNGNHKTRVIIQKTSTPKPKIFLRFFGDIIVEKEILELLFMLFSLTIDDINFQRNQRILFGEDLKYFK